MSISVVIPWRTDHGPRARAWAALRPMWRALAPDIELVVQVDRSTGLFNRSRLVNRAVARASGDVLIMAGADHIPNLDAIRTGAALAVEQAWTPLYSSVGYLSQVDTAAFIAGTPAEQLPDETVVDRATGPMAFTYEAFTATGGMDERFEGWGYEDTAHRLTLQRLFGDRTAPPARLRCLWHPETHRDLNSPNRALFEREYQP